MRTIITLILLVFLVGGAFLIAASYNRLGAHKRHITDIWSDIHAIQQKRADASGYGKAWASATTIEDKIVIAKTLDETLGSSEELSEKITEYNQAIDNYNTALTEWPERYIAYFGDFAPIPLYS